MRKINAIHSTAAFRDLIIISIDPECQFLDKPGASKYPEKQESSLHRITSVFQKSDRPSQEEVLALIKEAGYPSPTLLQSRVFPMLLQGKDVVVETQYGEGRTASFLVPLILQARRYSGTEPFALIISAHAENVHKTEQQLRILCRKNPLMYQKLGDNTTIKKEAKQLHSKSRIIIGTARRIIDHLRRKTLDIRHINSVIINFELSEKVKGFDKDIQFILSKVARRSQTGIFSSRLDNIRPLMPFLKRPYIITSDDWDSENRIQSMYEARDEKDKAEIVAGLLLTKRLESVVIHCRTMASLKTVEKHIADETVTYAILSGRTSIQKRNRVYDGFKAGKITVILTVCQNVIPLIPDIRNMIFLNIPEDMEKYTEICRYLSVSTMAKVTTLFTPEESSILKILQENHKMKKEQYPSDKDVVKGKIEGILQRIHEADPDELQTYKKLIKKHVPITRRAYVGALLFKESLGKFSKPAGPQKTLFINIGKNRRVFPRDLTRLFSKTLGIKPGDIGAIRVLDNYSFVEVPETIAQKAVEMMDGTDYRGRSIVVNFAKKKQD